MSGQISNVELQWPFKVSFKADGASYYYLIRQGGLVGPTMTGRAFAEYPIHHTPSGSFHFGPGACTLQDVVEAAGRLGSAVKRWEGFEAVTITAEVAA